MTAPNTPGIDPQIHAATEAFRRDYRAVQAEIGKAIVGHNDIVESRKSAGITLNNRPATWRASVLSAPS